MKYNPATEGYFGDTWSDRMLAQYEWANSTWYRSAANQPGGLGPMMTLLLIGLVVLQYKQGQMMAGPGIEKKVNTIYLK